MLAQAPRPLGRGRPQIAYRIVLFKRGRGEQSNAVGFRPPGTSTPDRHARASRMTTGTQKQPRSHIQTTGRPE